MPYARNHIIWQSATEQRAPQHVEVDQRAPRSTPAQVINVQSIILDVHVEVYICREIERQRQAQRIENALTVVKHHIPAREHLRQLAKRFSIRFQRQSTRELRIRRIERVMVRDERGRLALQSPVGQDACPVNYYEPVHEL